MSAYNPKGTLRIFIRHIRIFVFWERHCSSDWHQTHWSFCCFFLTAGYRHVHFAQSFCFAIGLLILRQALAFYLEFRISASQVWDYRGLPILLLHKVSLVVSFVLVELLVGYFQVPVVFMVSTLTSAFCSFRKENKRPAVVRELLLFCIEHTVCHLLSLCFVFTSLFM